MKQVYLLLILALAQAINACTPKQEIIHAQLVDSGYVHEGAFLYQNPAVYRSMYKTDNRSFILLSGNEHLLFAQKDTGKITITKQYTIPDSVWAQAQAFYYQYMPQKMDDAWVDSMNMAFAQERRAPKAIIYNYGYNSKAHTTHILCAFNCPYVKTIDRGHTRYNLIANQRPMFILTLDSAMQVQRLSYFSTNDIMNNGGTVAAVMGIGYNHTGDTLILPEIIKSDNQTKHALYGTYAAEHGVFKKLSASPLKYHAAHNLTMEGYQQYYIPAFAYYQNHLLLADFRNIYDVTQSKLLYTIPKDYQPGSRITGMASFGEYILLTQTDFKSPSRVDSPMYISVINMASQQIQRLPSICRSGDTYSLLADSNKVWAIYASGDALKYKLYEVY